MEKSENPVSKLIAVALAILNSIWIIPLGMFLIIKTVYLLRINQEYFSSRFSKLLSTTEGVHYLLIEHLVPYLIFLIGCLLFIGYIKRASNKLSKRLQPVLWITQIICSLPILYFMLLISLTRIIDSVDIMISTWAILIFILSSIALKIDISSK
jgi:hypothetical protein